MPDPAPLDMLTPTTAVPALSATSDAPDVVMPEPAVEAPPEGETVPPVDGTAKTDDTEGTAAEEAGGEANVEPPKIDGEGDQTSPAVKAAISRAKSQAKAAQAEAAELKANLSKALEAVQALTPKPEPPKPPTPEPRAEDYNSPEAYRDALKTWTADAVSQQTRAQVIQEVQLQRAQEWRQGVEQTHREREAAFVEEHPDYLDVTRAEDLAVTGQMAAAAAQVENGPAVFYWLGQHKDDSLRIAQLAPGLQALEIGKISERLSATPRAELKPKPAPITPLRGGNTNRSDPSTMSMDEYGSKRTGEMYGEGRQKALAQRR